MTKDEAKKIAAGIAKLPDVLAAAPKSEPDGQTVGTAATVKA